MQILALAEAAKQALIVVDEAFIDFLAHLQAR